MSFKDVFRSETTGDFTKEILRFEILLIWPLKYDFARTLLSVCGRLWKFIGDTARLVEFIANIKRFMSRDYF